ncbi:MAG TPA: NERD domain-containing protein [Leptolyngbyaceae cyanobacterium M33_DOE_097]|uniref:NERD domain-containing protein n=1 Tax=Oscillatoriales cyanobacterium SpSt-418 TaxID=2282169 RepID=A0A7C3KCY6_9CYAN|nr:NERD domain-containing protein [Leptolyngbyaceae cyanobacterium M33_DOE_097]
MSKSHSHSRRSPLTNNPLRNPGQSLDEEVNRLFQDDGFVWASSLIMSICWITYEWYRWLAKANPHPIGFTVVLLPYIIYAGFKLYRIKQKVKRLRIARDGEKAVGQFLSDLREQGYRIHHDILGKGFNIDHVIICDRGVFTIETKTYSKPISGRATIQFDGEQLTVDGKSTERAILQQAHSQAKWLQDLLQESTGKDLPVKPVIVFPGWFIEQTSIAKASQTWVLNPKALPSFLENSPKRLSQEDVKLASYHLSQYIRSTVDQ